MTRKLVVLTTALMAMGLIASACGAAATSDDTTRDTEGVVIEGGDVGVLALAIGDCFDDPPQVLDTEDDSLIDDVAALPCDEPHDNQVFAKFDLPDGDWPGSDAVGTQASDGCLDRFESAFDEAYETSPLGIFPLFPSEGGWSVGDQEVICSAYNFDLTKLTADLLG